MIAAELISQGIIPLRTSDSGNAGLLVMGDFNVYHLPVVNHEQLLGVISEEDIMNNTLEEAIGSYHIREDIRYVHERDHLFEIMQLLVSQDLSCIPVVDDENKYVGVIRLEDILKYFAESHSLSEIGSTFVILIEKHNYSLSEISRIIEAEEAKILVSFLTEMHKNPEQLFVTIKINRHESMRVIKALERHGYEIQGNYSVEDDNSAFYQDRFDSFMRYLNL